MSTPENLPRLDRRAAIKWMLTAAASVALLDRDSLGADKMAVPVPGAAAAAAGKGYGTDPDLLREYKPGELWPLSFTPAQRIAAAALCDTIIPADATSPNASSLGVHDFIDEWISAPYPAQQKDRPIVLEGLDWLDAESRRRFSADYADLVVSQRRALCDDICHVPKAKPEFKPAAHFFQKFRDLTAGGFYTTKEGMKDIGYVGNIPLATFDGPPPEVLKKLGLV